MEPEKTARRLLAVGVRQEATLGFILGVAAIVGTIALAACTQGSAPSPRTAATVPLQAGKQTVLPLNAMTFTVMTVDAKNVLYMGGGLGISTLASGATKPTPLKLSGDPTVSTLGASPDGTLDFVTLDGVVETVPPGSTTPHPLPFRKLRQFSQVAVGKDGTVYLGDNGQNKLLKLAPGASSPTELPVAGVSGLGHMVVDADDNLFISMMGKVVKIPKNATTTQPVRGVTDHVGGLAVDTAGNLYATDVKANTVSRMPAGGGDWAQLPFSGLQSPTNITVDGDGNVYVINQARQVVRLAAR